MGKTTKTREQLFWEKVDKQEGCWLWTASKDKNGYGFFNTGNGMAKAHRYLWEQKNRKLTKGEKLHNTCGNQSCVNPDHWYPHDPLAIFQENTSKTEACWIWNGTKDKDGYGLMNHGGKLKRAHRFAYEHHKGNIPPGMWALHTCDNPSCVNPDHLYLGTNVENVRDRMERKRQPDGEQHNDAKVTLRQVQDMRAEGKTGTYKSIGKRYGLSIAQTAKILNRQAWKNY